ncbi:MAG: class I SAM-dependent methyltransferase, partial [Chloroflexota bacterium]|nr:class I SAM-dependent methyltransferase [Chloroflexota bacterium]
SISKETVEKVVEKLEGRQVDLLFIDGDHEQSFGDWLAYRHLIKPGALVLFHDGWYSPVEDSMRATGLEFVNLGGWAMLSVARTPHAS